MAFRMVYMLLSIIVILAIYLKLFTKILPYLGRTDKPYNLTGGAIFKISSKQLSCIHLVIWGVATWLIVTLILFKTVGTELSQVLSEWGDLILFFLGFFLIIDIVLHIILKRSYLYVSTKEIGYRFGLIKRTIMPVEQIKSLEFKKEQVSINTISGVCHRIPCDGMKLLTDTEQSQRLLKELANIIASAVSKKLA